ncbi:unnamed protein product [Phytophthora lilii]|uniref:Unnamed protein product n=1 Tax=Phytophthora lilii TaxID=2077276 RepID=A0A9W6TD23_9STRA|nr:unnamed protein product [Phytophthora lilii]
MTGHSEPGGLQIVQPQWKENSEFAFDWYQYRAKKAGVLRLIGINTNLSRNSLDELVYYDRSYVLMKRVAAIWRAHSSKRKQCWRLQKLEAKALQYPSGKCNVMHVAEPHTENTATTNDYDNFRDADVQDTYLLTIDEHKHFWRRPLRLPLLWEGEAPNSLLCWTTGERQEVWDILNEMKESVCLASEVINVPCPEKESIIHDLSEDLENKNEFIDLINDAETTKKKHVAASLIQRVFARRRGLHRANSQNEAKRRHMRRLSIAILRVYFWFLGLMMKELSRSRAKKTVFLLRYNTADEVISNAAFEEGTIVHEVSSDRKRKQQLAKVQIHRFLVLKVNPYIMKKREMMVQRLQRWWKRKTYIQKWRELAANALLFHLEHIASTRIQRVYRHRRTDRLSRASKEKHALKKVGRALTRWLCLRQTMREERRCDNTSVHSLDVLESLPPQDEHLEEILENHGIQLYFQGDFWNAASILERLSELRKGNLNRDLQLKLAYSHHITWYTSYDNFNLLRAHDLYCNALEAPVGSKQASYPDASILHDLAIIMMHMEHFGDSLRLLAKLIEYFAQQPQFPLWLLLAGVQLQQQGEWEQSVVYLTYLHDIPPLPYLERDILVLCAIGYEQLALAAPNMPEARKTNFLFAKEAWRAALRQWNLEIIANEGTSSTSMKHARGNGRASMCTQKWELLINLGQRALEQGHYLVACRVFIYALNHDRSVLINDAHQAVWWSLADAFRHLGHLDLYLNAAQRSQITASNQAKVDEEEREFWRESAEQQACSFETELKTISTLTKLQQLGKH